MEGESIDTQKQYKKVGTHSGRFHADEVMATAILKELFELELVRTRDLGVLRELDLIYDVGDGEFDHHQLDKKYRESGTPYAACGLIWERFGREAVSTIEPTLTDEEVGEVFRYTDVAVMEGIDALDNGVWTGRSIIPVMSISSAISGFNPGWDSKVPEDEAFDKAVAAASAVLGNSIRQQVSAIKARVHVVEAFNRRTRPELLVLDKAYPWTFALYGADVENEVLFVIYPKDGQYLLQAVRKNEGAFANRKSLPQSWAGKRDEELAEITGIEDAVFCHPARFIAGAGTMESMLKMADLAIAEPEPAPEMKKVEVHGFLMTLRRLLHAKRFVIKR